MPAAANSNCEGYMSGFGNEFASEALPGALPRGQNSPQKPPYGLYAEQLSGSAFTASRGANLRSWLYRIRPSVLHMRQFLRVSYPLWTTPPAREARELIGQMRWRPPSPPVGNTTFVAGLRTMTTAGDAGLRLGMSAGLYFVAAPMQDEYFCDADGDLLIVPQEGSLDVSTEFGFIDVAPGEFCLIPRGVKFRVSPAKGPARGYYCENYGAPFVLPNRGVIGANGLANPRDFLIPTAAFEDRETSCILILKWGGAFYQTNIAHSPLDVVAWHGNYAPYKYAVRNFVPVGALLLDHPDPSIFTVLTSPSLEPGVGEIDFVVFPERWQVAEHSFRPPWFHSNVMSEFMGLIYGKYDAKPEAFLPGGVSLHNRFLPHGPDAEAFERARCADLHPEKLTNTLAFMFETRLSQHPTAYACDLDTLEPDYAECWSGLRKRFDGTPEGQAE